MKNTKWYSLVTLLLAVFLVSCSTGQQAEAPQSNVPAKANSSPPLPSPVRSYVYPRAVATGDVPAPVPGTPTKVEPSSKINKDLARTIATSSPSTQIEFYVVLNEQATLNDDISNLSKSEKGDYVLRKSKEVADRTQPAVAAALQALQKSGAVSKYEALTTPNAFYVVGTSHAITSLAERDDIRYLQPNYQYHIDEPHPIITPTELSFAPFRCASLKGGLSSSAD